jgi:hypothetical protein
LARRDGKPFFGVIGIVPEANSREVKSGVRLFQNKVLLPENADRVAAFMYEDYIAVLNGGSAEAKEFAKFLTPLL